MKKRIDLADLKKDYWSKEAFEDRIKAIGEDIALLRRMKNTPDVEFYSQDERTIWSLIESRKMHRIAFKVHHMNFEKEKMKRISKGMNLFKGK